MALQSSGQIKLSEIAAEFGGSAPHALSEYHGEGNAPSSGEIQLAADFYGTSSNLAQFVISCGQNSPKVNSLDTGYITTATGGNVSIGSVSSGSLTFGGRTVVKVSVNQNTNINNTTLFIAFSGTANADSIWTSVQVHNVGRNRVNFSGNVINNTAYQYSITLGGASVANPLPNNATRTITFN